ncbi:MAG TPA: hypothetical protein VG206_07270, partial [Terriglobia bacterium]|nr:hypothetical protein [Terriglobia bacterium]
MNAPKLRSLLDMLRVNAYHYIQAAELLSEIESGIDPSWLTNNQALSPDTVQQIKNTLPTLATHCSQLHLETTETLITKFL